MFKAMSSTWGEVLQTIDQLERDRKNLDYYLSINHQRRSGPVEGTMSSGPKKMCYSWKDIFVLFLLIFINWAQEMLLHLS